MPSLDEELLVAFELHAPDGIRAVLDAGLDVRAPIRGKPVVSWLTEMYTRSPRLPACLRLLLERGARLEDPVLEPVLLDDADALAAMLGAEPWRLAHRTSMVSAFTPLVGATLLHVAAEYGSTAAARTLIAMGADVDARAAVDAQGFGGHTPLFHTGNSILNHAQPVLRLLLEAGARPDVRVQGLVWGKGFEWETTFFDLTPISYAQLGLLPQVHRRETDIYDNLRLLLRAAGREVPEFANVPNRYLRPRPGEGGAGANEP